MCKSPLQVSSQRETAVLRDLLEHVIEKSQAGGDAARPLARQVDIDRDLGFPGPAPHLRAASGPENARGDGRPGLSLRSRRGGSRRPVNAQIRGELQIGVAVADHEAARRIDRMRSR